MFTLDSFVWNFAAAFSAFSICVTRLSGYTSNYFIATLLRPNGLQLAYLVTRIYPVSRLPYLVSRIWGICKSPVSAVRVRMRARLADN